MIPSTKAQGNWNGGHPKTANRILADHLGVILSVVKRMGGVERLARMTTDARAIMAGPALAERMEFWDWEAHK